MFQLGQRIAVRVKMKLLATNYRAPGQADVLAPKASPTELHSSGSTGYKASSDPSTAVLPQVPRALLTAEEKLIMIEHLPLLRCVARRVHGRLSQHLSGTLSR
jgi:hypothetical protein